MLVGQKRKAPPTMDATAASRFSHKRQGTESAATNSDQEDGGVPLPKSQTNEQDEGDPLENTDTSTPTPTALPATGNSRLDAQRARFAALKARQNESRVSNRKEATLESQRASFNPSAATSLNRKKAVAEQKLARADAEAAGEDYERKRAWDWTIDESERWDRRMTKKEKHREDVAFASYGQDARKVYKRQLREIGGPDVEGYEREKAEAVRKAADEGRLDLVEKEDGEVLAVDREGTWFGGREAIDIIGKGKVEKDKVDKLVGELKKAEEVRLRKLRQRKGEDAGDVTYINDKNKVSYAADWQIDYGELTCMQQFNEKLARFYNKYTTDIRDSFERGTAI